MTSAAAVLDASFTALIGKARQEFEQEQQTLKPITINVNFGGGGSALSTGRPCIARIPVPCVIQSIELYAGNELGQPVVVTTAIVDLWTTTADAFASGGQTPLHDTGAKAALAGESYHSADLTGWILNLTATDRLVGRIATWSGTATWLGVLISAMPTGVPQGTANVTDGTSLVVDDGGNQIIFQN